MTDVAVFLLPSFEGAGDDHQRALLHAVSETSCACVLGLRERSDFDVAGCSWRMRWC